MTGARQEQKEKEC